MQFKEPVLFTVDDEAWTVGFWDQCEFDDAFGGVVFDGTDSLQRAMEYASDHISEPTVFVLDSRMYLSDDARRQIAVSLRDRLGVDVDRFETEGNLNGVLVAAWIRGRSDAFRVVLLTAFAREIAVAVREDTELRRVFETGVSEMFGKSVGEKPLRRKIRGLLEEVGRPAQHRIG